MKPVRSFVWSWELGWISGVCLKTNEPLWSRTLWSKSYVFQNKAKMYARGDPLTTVMCRQRTIWNQITSNNSQCELDFHAEVNFQTKWKTLNCFEQVKFLCSMCKIKEFFFDVTWANTGATGPVSRPYIVQMTYHKLYVVLRQLSAILTQGPKV